MKIVYVLRAQFKLSGKYPMFMCVQLKRQNRDINMMATYRGVVNKEWTTKMNSIVKNDNMVSFDKTLTETLSVNLPFSSGGKISADDWGLTTDLIKNLKNGQICLVAHIQASIRALVIVSKPSIKEISKHKDESEEHYLLTKTLLIRLEPVPDRDIKKGKERLRAAKTGNQKKDTHDHKNNSIRLYTERRKIFVLYRPLLEKEWMAEYNEVDHIWTIPEHLQKELYDYYIQNVHGMCKRPHKNYFENIQHKGIEQFLLGVYPTRNWVKETATSKGPIYRFIDETQKDGGYISPGNNNESEDGDYGTDYLLNRTSVSFKKNQALQRDILSVRDNKKIHDNHNVNRYGRHKKVPSAALEQIERSVNNRRGGAKLLHVPRVTIAADSNDERSQDQLMEGDGIFNGLTSTSSHTEKKKSKRQRKSKGSKKSSTVVDGDDANDNESTMSLFDGGQKYVYNEKKKKRRAVLFDAFVLSYVKERENPDWYDDKLKENNEDDDLQQIINESIENFGFSSSS